ncbi:hypothetical protein ABES25_06540 [Bacillus gobiensis]|uniref:hypothetical protein n=1 Tax=Bacillus gobiensis TaxID=1441095 RepID=UPI003D1CAD11
MFVLTGVIHFVGMREELISMVPPTLPNPGLIVTITGLLELAGAVGLMLRPTVSCCDVPGQYLHSPRRPHN